MADLLHLAESWRRTLWRAMTRTSLGRRCAHEPSTRLAVLALGHMSLALALTVLAPLWLLLLGPLLLGVPHVMADIRYLLLRPATPSTRRFALAVGLSLLALTALRIVAVLGGESWSEGEQALGVAAVLAGVLSAHSVPYRRTLALTLALAIAVFALTQPYQMALWLGHLHNFVALGLWLVWSWPQKPTLPPLAVLAAYATCLTLLASGLLESLPAGTALGLDFPMLVAELAPGMAPEIALRLVLIFAFAQAVHYTVWLRLVPNTPIFATRRSAPTLRRALDELRPDLGRMGCRLALGACLLVPLLGLFDPVGIRAIYLSLVLFHGWHELAAITHLIAGRRA